MALPTPKCRLSDPAHPHFLSYQNYYLQSDGEAFETYDWYYHCDVCDIMFDKDCNVIMSLPAVITHPYHHREHLLNFTIQISKTEAQSFNTQAELHQYISKVDSNDGYLVFKSVDGCDWCGEGLGNFFYRCLVCGFCLDRSCVRKDPPLTITNPKSHQHSLTLFPRPLSVACNACALGNKNEEPGYVCLPCNYFVHQSCIDLPRVIKLTRHPHWLSLTPYLPPPVKRSCGVCHKDVDVKRGMYSCDKGCPYAIHSKCAIHKDIWDGIDLEGVPEEPEEDLSPFVEVGHNLIKHFTHEHNLEFGEDHEGYKECEACCRPVDSDGFYRCTVLHCDFFLHAPCANFLKKKEHPIHKHSLVLQPSVSNLQYTCHACKRVCNGFSYNCLKNSCRDSFAMDVGCASVCEPFEHKVHQHPMFFFSGRDISSLCGICGERIDDIYTLHCNDCKFNMCFKCATIPVVIHYRHDEHPLALSTGEDSSDPYWCEKCERRMDPKKWFYTCDKCCTTLHIDCVFEGSSFIKIGTTGVYDYPRVTFASNYGNSRPVCDECGVRCPDSRFFKIEEFCVCSVNCLYKTRVKIFDRNEMAWVLHMVSEHTVV